MCLSVSLYVCLFVCVCSVDSELTVQLTDSALSRDLFPRDYVCLGDNENRPVKWLAVEALVDRRYSPASDAVCTTLFLSLCLCLFVCLTTAVNLRAAILINWIVGLRLC